MEDYPDEEALRGALANLGVGLTPYEVRRLRELLGRNPTLVELHIFNAEWSEHCSYKSSKSTLQEFLPTSGPTVMLGPGEDAGIIFLAEVEGERYGIVIAHESHNHPSQVLPVEGAATGIGGIVRDVDCMGAHVFATADPLRFGDPYGEHRDRTRWIATGVVDGIWQYGNALGVPVVAGDVVFSRSFDDNCLVNVVALGLVKESEIIRSHVPPEAAWEPYDLILVGKPTDDSGFGGAAFASEILGEEAGTESRGAVQVPDPFLKNVLLLHKANEAVRNAARRAGAVLSMKDLGAAGVVCSTSEMCAAGGFGARVDLDRVHVSLEGLRPEVIACAETQERYLWAVPRWFTPTVLRIYNQDWELPRIYEGARAQVIGEVTSDLRYLLTYRGEVVCDADIRAVTGGLRCQREARPREWTEPEPSPEEIQARLRERFESWAEEGTYNEVLLALLHSPNVASREYLYRIYDTEVQGNAVLRPGEADAGLMAPLAGHPVGVALSVDGNPFYGRISPFWGGATAVAEAMRNVAAVGATPYGLTDCLNFGDPEKPEAFWEFRESVRGLAEAARNLWLKGHENTPVPFVSGNVSFYNESEAGHAVDPSPIVACLGVMEDYSKALTLQLKEPGNRLYLVGERYDELGGSAFYHELLGLWGANVPQVRWERERGMIYGTIDAVNAGLVRAVHDISNGGLITTVAEMMMGGWAWGTWGAEIDLDRVPLGVGVASQVKALLLRLFAESSGFVLEVPPSQAEELEATFARCGVTAFPLGEVAAHGRLIVKSRQETLIDVPLEEMKTAWTSGLPEAMR
ncbi:MAG TPA: phosphoribosylformylglycinamidine synthase subunit PurL [Armatimonadetes bacterium]|nr:phosphoribosylformylglycinamidine synthase subunit PurL [Armatimonadota bacterium]